ncbi:MAG: pyridoxal phosphate-dependent aminotransferase [Pseudolabrys sp.]
MAEPAKRATAERFRVMRPSATVENTERIRAARAAGLRILGLSSGDPNIVTDPRIIAAAERAMRSDKTHYSSPAGEPGLRDAIVKRESERSGAQYHPDDILITPGGKFALLTGLMSIINPGDEVLVPEPGWVSYGPCVRLCGGVPVAVPMLDRLDPDAIAGAITARTRALILNSPVNPTGRVLREDELAATIAIAQRHDLWIVFDQVYSDLIYGGRFAYPQGLVGGFERTLVVDSLSKSFGMTGWRLGYLALPAGMAKAAVKFLQHSIYCVPAFIQAAGEEALSLRNELVPAYRGLFRRRLQRAAAALDAVPGISCAMSEATFYLFPRVGGDDRAVAQRWLADGDVAVMPGSAFGPAGKGHLRLSLGCSDEDLEEALARIARLGV